MNDYLNMFFETAKQHIPESAVWMPQVGTGVLALVGLILMLRGGKLAPFVAACAFLGIGGLGGWYASAWIGTPLWPSVAVTGLIGLVLGLLLFRVWLGLLTGACFIAAALTVYGVRVVAPYIENYASQGYDAQAGLMGVSLADPGTLAASTGTRGAELAHLWSYLVSTVPAFQTNFWAITASTGLAGLLVGLLLPRLSRALFAATAGTFCMFLALVMALKVIWPSALAWLTTLGTWSWGIVAAVWLFSLLHNFFTMRRRHVRRKAAEEEAPEGEPATA
ncbi:MAG: hypothetical protein PVJ57_06350 [Phycisphaerae bacterium]|jgi:hypothetical protein